MKRLLIIVLTLFMTGCTEDTFLDCKGNENVAGVCIDSTPPIITGIDDIEVELHEEFLPLDGVLALDDIDGDITEHIIVTEHVDTSRPGLYLVKYEVEDSFLNKTTEVRYVKVTNNVELGSNMIYNGSFDFGMDGWNIYEFEGANGHFEVINNALKITIESIEADTWYSPRIDFNSLILEQGEYYSVTFDMKSDSNRSVLVQVGELLPAEPWYDDLALGINKIYALTNEYQTFQFSFQMTKPTNDNASIIFEMGDVMNEYILTNIYLDNVSFTRITEEEYELLNVLTIPGTIEAEDFTQMYGIQVEQTGDITGYQNVGYIDENDWLTYQVNVEETGDYLIFSRVATTVNNREMTVELDDMFLFQITIPNTNGWQTYTTVSSGIIHIEAGIYELKISTTTGGFNINYLIFEKVN